MSQVPVIITPLNVLMAFEGHVLAYYMLLNFHGKIPVETSDIQDRLINK